MGIPLCIVCCFSLAACNICSLCLIFKTHINQINEDQTQRTDIKSSEGKKKITRKGILIRITADISIETLQARREWQDILKSDEREKPMTKISLPSKISLHSYMKEKSKALQISKR